MVSIEVVATFLTLIGFLHHLPAIIKQHTIKYPMCIILTLVVSSYFLSHQLYISASLVMLSYVVHLYATS